VGRCGWSDVDAACGAGDDPCVSDALQFLVDELVTEAEAPYLARRLRERLAEEGWIEREATNECVLGGLGHKPGPLARSSFVPLHTPRTNGVAIEAARFTSLVYPFEAELFVCPGCEAPVDIAHLVESVEAWVTGEPERAVTCTGCDRTRHAREWRSTDPGQSPIVFGNLALRFYNWPPLRSPQWKQSIVDCVTKIVGRPLSPAWGHL
jgi:hypothetical protein